MRAGVVEGQALVQLRALIAAEGGELAAALVPEPAGECFGPLVAASERCAAAGAEYAVLVESIFEGYLVHYGRGRVVEAADEDLRLLAGDYLYALGLSRLAALGDLVAVRELAAAIALCAQVHAGPERPLPGAPEAVWALGTLGVAGGQWDAGEAAKRALREARADAPSAALEAASARAAELGIAREAQRALIAFREIPVSDPEST